MRIFIFNEAIQTLSTCLIDFFSIKDAALLKN
jgi:hypothetical protein